MADSLVSRHIPALFNGVSQQNPTLRQPSQATAQVNCHGTVMDGLRKRPPFQHVARVTETDITDAFIHTINRDVTERYVVVVTDGDLKVYNADTGEAELVTFPTGKAYLALNGGIANSSFALDSVADYTFVVNKTLVTATKPTPTTPPAGHEEWYRPEIWGSTNPDDYTSSAGAGVLTGSVNTFSDLPKASDPQPPAANSLYKVFGYDDNNFSGYYVRRVGSVWEETYGPGANISLDEVTLPHALVRQADGSFVFAPFTWNARKYGDEISNPPPTFINRTINGVFYWKNRLGFITDENVVMSGSGDYGNFWRNTMTTLLDSDVVDVAQSSSKVSILEYAIPFNNSMMLFSDQTQYSFNVADLLTPTSVSIDAATHYEMDKGVKPVSIGSEVYFVSKSGSHSRLREYFVSNEGTTTEAADVTAHVQRYVPKNIIQITGNSTENCVFAISSEPGFENRIYVYKFFWSGDEKVQSAWSYWELDSDDVILSIEALADALYILVKRADGTYLEKCELASGETTGDLDFDILLDRRYELKEIEMFYSPALDETTLGLPFEILNQADLKVITTVGTGDVGKLIPQSSYTFPVIALNNEIVVPGDVTGSKPYVGTNYVSDYQFSEQFVYDQGGNADTTGRLQLRTFTVTYQDSGYFTTKVYPYGTDFAANIENVVPANVSDFTGRQLGDSSLLIGEPSLHSGDYTFYVDGVSTDVVVSIGNDSHLQANLMSCQWEGSFTKRTRSM